MTLQNESKEKRNLSEFMHVQIQNADKSFKLNRKPKMMKR